VDREGRVRRIASRFELPGEERAGIYAWANVLSPRAFESLPDREAFSHLDGWWAPALARGAQDIRGFVADAASCLWEPVGTAAEYLAANLALRALSYLDVEEASRRAGATLVRDAAGLPSLVLGAGARLGPGARLARAVVWEGEQVPAGFEAAGGVFARGAWHACEPEAGARAGAGGAAR
jgi:NDP-sugar pyrophosphorylase family protein